MVDITNLITSLLEVIVSICAVFVIPAFKKWIMTKVSKNSFEMLLIMAEAAVNAAEQIFDHSNPEKKKEYVIHVLENYGFTFDDRVDAAIESAVLKLGEAVKE